MKKEPKILKEKNVFNGFNRIDEYDIQAPSLRNENEYAKTINREVIKGPDASLVLIYCKPDDSFVFCEQFRTGPHFNKSNDDPSFILEIVAGMVDENYTPLETALKETREETGITLENAEHFLSCYPSSGRLAQKDHFFYAEIDMPPETGVFGNPEEAEEIRTHLIKREKAYAMVDNLEFLHMQTIYALNWFRLNKDSHL